MSLYGFSFIKVSPLSQSMKPVRIAMYYEFLARMTLSSKEGFGQPAQMHRLTRAFAARMDKRKYVDENSDHILIASPAGYVGMCV